MWARNWGGVVLLFWEARSPSNMAVAEAYLHAKVDLYPSNRLATIHQHHRQDRQRSDSVGRTVFSEREVTFTFAICCGPAVCRLSSVYRLSVMLVRPTQPVKIFGNVSTPFGTLAIH